MSYLRSSFPLVSLLFTACASNGPSVDRSPGTTEPPSPAGSVAGATPAAATSGRASCIAVAADFIDAVNRRDTAAWRSLYADPARVEAAFTCPDLNIYASMIRDELRQDEQSDLESNPPDLDLRFAPEITKAEDTKKLAPGDAAEASCIAREPLELTFVNAHYREGDTHNVHLHQIACIGLAGRWYALQIF